MFGVEYPFAQTEHSFHMGPDDFKTKIDEGFTDEEEDHTALELMTVLQLGR